MLLLEGTRFLKDYVSILDGTQLAALRLGGVGLGIILLLLLRPQGMLREPQRKAFLLTDEAVNAATAPVSAAARPEFARTETVRSTEVGD